jgi:hypothetical protein
MSELRKALDPLIGRMRREETMLVKLQEGPSQCPSLAHIYDFFAPRSSKLTIWSFGLGFGGIETNFIESTGSKVHVFDARPEAVEKNKQIQRVLQSHELDENDPDWIKPLADVWIPPNKLIFSTTIPWSHDGILTVNGQQTSITQIKTSEVPRVDICKIEYPGLTYEIVYILLHTGYRPGLLYIRWDEHPDKGTEAMLCAGHLQNCGYGLAAELDGYFLYRFIDDCVYETCSWARTDCINPLFDKSAP